MNSKFYYFSSLALCFAALHPAAVQAGCFEEVTTVEVSGLKQIDLVGYGDLGVTRRLLAQHGVTPIAYVLGENGQERELVDTALEGEVRAKFVFSTDAGKDFRETYLAVFVRRTGEGLRAKTGLFFFENVNNSRPRVALARTVWRSPHVFGTIDFHHDFLEGPNGFQTTYRDFLNPFAREEFRGRVTLADASRGNVAPQNIAYDMYAYSPLTSDRYRFCIAGPAKNIPFDARAQDRFEIARDSVWGRVVARVGFEPHHFQLIDNMRYSMGRLQ